jgi:hypothetical protein
MPRTLSADEKVAIKRERVPVHEAKDKIKSIHGLDHKNFYYRFVRETPDRVEKFLNAGYTFVQSTGQNVQDPTAETLSQGKDSLIRINGGLGTMLVLMALPIELWNEDQAAKAEEIELTEAQQFEQLRRQASTPGGYGEITQWGSKGNSTLTGVFNQK